MITRPQGYYFAYTDNLSSRLTQRGSFSFGPAIGSIHNTTNYFRTVYTLPRPINQRHAVVSQLSQPRRSFYQSLSNPLRDSLTHRQAPAHYYQRHQAVNLAEELNAMAAFDVHGERLLQPGMSAADYLFAARAAEQAQRPPQSPALSRFERLLETSQAPSSQPQSASVAGALNLDRAASSQAGATAAATPTPHIAERNLRNLHDFFDKLPTAAGARAAADVQKLHLAAVHYHEISSILLDPSLTNNDKDDKIFKLCGITCRFSLGISPQKVLQLFKECLDKCFSISPYSKPHREMALWFDFQGETGIISIHKQVVNGPRWRY